jgi:hypothetical protein
MENKTSNNVTNTTGGGEGPYFSIEFWYKLIGSSISQEILYVSLIPISTIGVVLNIMALIVMRSSVFNLPFYTYLRGYTICSLFIRLWNVTQFTAGTRTLIKITNSAGSFAYYCFFYVLLLTWTNACGSFFDIVLSMERAVLLSKKLDWFKKLKPKLLSLIFVIASLLIVWPVGTLFRPFYFEVNLNKTTKFKVHLFTLKAVNKVIGEWNGYMPYIIDICPIIIETAFNVLSVYLIKRYTKQKLRIVATNKTIGNTRLATQTMATGAAAAATTTAAPSMNQAGERTKRMEVKLTILVIFMSILSTM